MKKFVILLAAMLLIALPALAEIQPAAVPVGEQLTTDGDNIIIVRVDFSGAEKEIPSVYTAVYSTWLLDDGSLCNMQDVNFDGHDDLVITTIAGASNAAYTFYLWNEETGSFEWFGGEDLWNYQLYPAQRMVQSHGTSGWAGLLHSDVVYAWDETGRQLKPVRSSEWDTLSEFTSEQNGEYMRFNETYDESVLVETYVDYENEIDESFAHPTKNYDDPDFMAERFLYESNFLKLEVGPEDNNDGTNG